jgi:hypothetical protein
MQQDVPPIVTLEDRKLLLKNAIATPPPRNCGQFCLEAANVSDVSRALERLPEMTYLLLQATEDRHASSPFDTTVEYTRQACTCLLCD